MGMRCREAIKDYTTDSVLKNWEVKSGKPVVLNWDSLLLPYEELFMHHCYNGNLSIYHILSNSLAIKYWDWLNNHGLVPQYMWSIARAFTRPNMVFKLKVRQRRHCVETLLVDVNVRLLCRLLQIFDQGVDVGLHDPEHLHKQSRSHPSGSFYLFKILKAFFP